jgi:hypothetical protein
MAAINFQGSRLPGSRADKPVHSTETRPRGQRQYQNEFIL